MCGFGNGVRVGCRMLPPSDHGFTKCWLLLGLLLGAMAHMVCGSSCSMRGFGNGGCANVLLMN